MDCAILLLDDELERTRTMTMAMTTPVAPIQVMEARDTCSTATPPIPAPAAMANCIID